MWFQDLSSSAEQFQIGDNKGFDSNASGIVFGFDYPVRDGAATVGFALALNDSNVVSRGASASTTGISAETYMLYGAHQLDSASYLSGMMSYGRVTNSLSRTPVPGVTATAEQDAESYAISGEWGSSGILSLPNLGIPLAIDARTSIKTQLGYSIFDPEPYTETGAGGLNLTVTPENAKALTTGIQLAFEWDGKIDFTYNQNLGKNIDYTFGLYGGFSREWLNEKVGSTSSFEAGGAPMETESQASDQNTLSIGTYTSFNVTDDITVDGGYEVTTKKEFISRSAFFKIRRQF